MDGRIGLERRIGEHVPRIIPATLRSEQDF